jgi:hypothetical protein
MDMNVFPDENLVKVFSHSVGCLNDLNITSTEVN